MTTSTPTSQTETVLVAPDSVAGRYLAAWQAHDLDAIMALHTPDTVYTSAATGTEAIGHEAVREAIAGVFALWPELRFHPLHVHVTPEFIVGESMLQVTQAVPLPLGDTTLEPSGTSVTFAIADVLELEDGLVKRKASYFDVFGYVSQMHETSES